MKLEDKIKIEPQLFDSDYLSKKTGLKVSILDYSCTSTGTHKLKKFIEHIKEAKKKNQGIFLFINPVIDSREDSNGSGIDALELASAVLYPESRVVCVVHSDKPYLKPEPINENFQNKRKRIIWGLNLNEFWGKGKLENYFRDLIIGKRKLDKNHVKNVKEILEKRELNMVNCLDLTNLNNCDCYVYSDDLVKELEKFDYIVGSAGTGERAVGQIKSLQNGKLKHIIVIPNGHPLDPFHRYEKSDSERIQTKYRVKTHGKLIKESIYREDIIYKSVGLFGGKKAKEMFVDKAIKKDKLNMKSSPDGAIGFTILREKDNPQHKNYFTKEGLRVFNTHKASKTGLNYIYNTIIPYNSKVCIINTGCSNNTLLKKLIEKGLVK